VGALQGLAQLATALGSRTPFPILVGVSAGAVNAAALAAGADDLQSAVDRLARIWSTLVPSKIYRTDSRSLARIGVRWIRDLTTSGVFGENTINHLLDTAPLRRLLASKISTGRIREHLCAGLLEAYRSRRRTT
jgi:NTE family protein